MEPSRAGLLDAAKAACHLGEWRFGGRLGENFAPIPPAPEPVERAISILAILGF